MASTSLADTAYRQLRAMIVTLELAPGELVKQQDLQDRLGLGRTPIHQALLRLERDELVTVVPRRGVFVTNVDVMELPVLYESRAILEPHMARMAAIRGTSDHWAHMRELLTDVAPDSPVQHLVSIDRTCHEIMWDAAGNRFLSATLDMLYTQSDRLWHQHLIDVTNMDQSLDEHRLLLDAFEAGNAELASTLMDEHIRVLHDQIRDVIAENLHSPLPLARSLSVDGLS